MKIAKECLICGDTIYYTGKQNDIIYIKTKRKSVLVIHKDCIEKEKKDGHIKSKKEQYKKEQYKKDHKRA